MSLFYHQRVLLLVLISFSRVRGQEAVPGEAVPGEGVSDEGVSGEAVPGEGVSGDCVDQYESECIEWKSKNMCRHINTREAMRQYCPVRCGFCTPPRSACRDLSESCLDWRNAGLCNTTDPDYKVTLAVQCRRTCETCHVREPCADVSNVCDKLAGAGLCEQELEYMYKHCKQSCNFCDNQAKQTVVVKFVGWSEWGEWSICDVVCGDGIRYRSRSCRGGTCFGNTTDSQLCFVKDCPKAFCLVEESSYCPFYSELGYCESSVEYMTQHCPVSCHTCTELQNSDNTLSTRFKYCVKREIDAAVSTSINKIERYTTRTEITKENVISESDLPSRAQARLRKLSRQARALTIQDKLFNNIISLVTVKCGRVSTGTGYIESILLESKVIQVANIDCAEQCNAEVGTVYRHVNGTCNNCENPLWGSTTHTMGRLLDPDFEDNELSLPRGWTQNLPGAQVDEKEKVPTPRLVRQLLLDTADIARSRRFTLMHFQWGQFLDHDLVLTPTNPDSVTAGGDVNCEHICVNKEPCFPILLSADDPIANMTDGKRKCLPFTRSAGIKFNTLGASSYSNQINEVTSFIDASNVYGSSEFLGLLLKNTRFHPQKGSLKTGEECGEHAQGRMLPDCPKSSRNHFCACAFDSCPEKYIAGDVRVNEQPMLIVMHTLWVREHNRIAGALRAVNPCWNSDKLFQETRKIVIGMMQHITYRLFLSTLLGPEGFSNYVGFEREGHVTRYDPNIQPDILNEFATAAFRYGHSQIPGEVPSVDEDWERIENLTSSLHSTFFRANMVCGCGFDNILRGLLSVPVGQVDQHFSDDVVNRLFAPAELRMGLDLASINIQRGRDHGIAPYVKYKEYCERKYKVQAVLRNEPETSRMIRLVYGSLDKVDLFVGGLLEVPIKDGMLGPTFSCIIGEQFKRLRNGDRFFYTHKGVFTVDQVKELFKTSLSRVACENSLTIDKVPKRAFLFQDPDGFVPCKALPNINFDKWKDDTC